MIFTQMEIHYLIEKRGGMRRIVDTYLSLNFLVLHPEH